MANDVSKSKVLEQLVQLIIATTNFEATWVRFLLALQGGLAAAMWAVAAYTEEGKSSESPEEPLFLVVLSVLIPFFGVVTCAAITIIHVGIGRWNRWYIRQIRELNLPHKIFPPREKREEDEPETVTKLKEFPVGRRARVMVGVNMLILIAWACVAALRLWSTSYNNAWAIGLPTAMTIVAIVTVWCNIKRKRKPSGKPPAQGDVSQTSVGDVAPVLSPSDGKTAN